MIFSKSALLALLWFFALGSEAALKEHVEVTQEVLDARKARAELKAKLGGTVKGDVRANNQWQTDRDEKLREATFQRAQEVQSTQIKRDEDTGKVVCALHAKFEKAFERGSIAKLSPQEQKALSEEQLLKARSSGEPIVRAPAAAEKSDYFMAARDGWKQKEDNIKDKQAYVQNMFISHGKDPGLVLSAADAENLQKRMDLDAKKLSIETLLGQIMDKMNAGKRTDIVIARRRSSEGSDEVSSAGEVEDATAGIMDQLLATRGANTAKNYGSVRASLTWDNNEDNNRFDLDLHLHAPNIASPEGVYWKNREEKDIVGNWKLDLDHQMDPVRYGGFDAPLSHDAAENIFWNAGVWTMPASLQVIRDAKSLDELIHTPSLPPAGKYKVNVVNFVNQNTATKGKPYELVVRVDGDIVNLYREKADLDDDAAVPVNGGAPVKATLDPKSNSRQVVTKHTYHFKYDPQPTLDMRRQVVELLQQLVELEELGADIPGLEDLFANLSAS